MSESLRVVAIQLLLHSVIDWVLHKREESANSICQSIYRAECLYTNDFGVIIRNGSVPELYTASVSKYFNKEDQRCDLTYMSGLMMVNKVMPISCAGTSVVIHSAPYPSPSTSRTINAAIELKLSST